MKKQVESHDASTSRLCSFGGRHGAPDLLKFTDFEITTFPVAISCNISFLVLDCNRFFRFFETPPFFLLLFGSKPVPRPGRKRTVPKLLVMLGGNAVTNRLVSRTSRLQTQKLTSLPCDFRKAVIKTYLIKVGFYMIAVHNHNS